MAKKSNAKSSPVVAPLKVDKSNIDSESSERLLAFPLKASVRGKATLWLMLKQNKEYPPGYRHAWGKAWVSTRNGGPANVRVQKIRLRIRMPSPGGTITSDEVKNNATSVKADTKYSGIVAGNFRSAWLAEATQPGYGTWRLVDTW